MGEKFIENLERINKARVEQGEPLQEQVAAPAAQQDDEANEDVVIDLNAKKKKGDNIFMDFMALYARSSVKDKTKK